MESEGPTEMTDQRDETSGDAGVGVEQAAEAVGSAGISRRALMRGVSVAAPAIFTLGSGSVQAAMVSAVVITPSNGPDNGLFHCLNEKTTASYAGSPYPPGSLVKDPMLVPEATRYPDRVHKLPATTGSGSLVCNGSTAEVSELEMCKQESSRGVYCYYSTSEAKWKQINVPRGSVTSLSAMASFGVTSFKDV